MKKIIAFLIWLFTITPAWAQFADASHGICLNFSNPDKPIFSTVSLVVGDGVRCGIEFGGYSMTGNNEGEGFLWWNADDWNGTPIDWQVVTPLFPNNNPSQSGSMKKFVVMTDGFFQYFQARAYCLTTNVYGGTVWQPQDGTIFYYNPVSSTDITTWNQGASTNFQPQFFDMSSKGNGRFWVLRVFGGANADQHIDLVGVQTIQTVGGLKQ